MTEKKYVITYPVVGAICGGACFLILFLGGTFGLIYCICFSAASAAIGCLISRIVLHETDEDNSLKTWQVTIYFAVTVIGWVCACFASTWMWSSIWLCLFACGLVLALGTRFLEDKNCDGIPDIFQDKKYVNNQERLYSVLKYKFIRDKFMGALDTSRPLIVGDGELLTVKDAEAKGIDVTEAKAYIDQFFN